MYILHTRSLKIPPYTERKMVNVRMDTACWDWKKDFGELFDEGEDGLPVVGQVIKYFRGLRGVNTSQLASMLGVQTKRTVERMENENLFVDSITRRRSLVAALRIPPLLLGITPFVGMPPLEEAQTVAIAPAAPKRLHIAKSVDDLRETLTSYWNLHQNSHAQGTLALVERDIQEQREALSLFTGQERTERQHILCTYSFFACDLGRELRNYAVAFAHADSAVDLSVSLNTPMMVSPDLAATAFLTRACTYYERGTPQDLLSAKEDFDAGTSYAQHSRASLHANFVMSSNVTSMRVAKSFSDRKAIRLKIDETGKLVPEQGSTHELDIRYHTKPITPSWYQNQQSLALLDGNYWKEALASLNEEFDKIPPGSRSLAYNHIYRARAEAALENFPYATELASLALTTFEQTKSKLGIIRVSQVVQTISANPRYGNTVEIAQLRARLINHKTPVTPLRDEE